MNRLKAVMMSTKAMESESIVNAMTTKAKENSNMNIFEPVKQRPLLNTQRLH